jgi:hypothetical protein
MVFNVTLKQYVNYIVAISFIGRRIEFFFKLHFLKFLYDQTTIDEKNSSYLSLDGSTYNKINLSKEWSIWLWRLKCHFQQYFSYNMAVSCIGGGNWSPRENHIGLPQVTDKLD